MVGAPAVDGAEGVGVGCHVARMLALRLDASQDRRKT